MFFDKRFDTPRLSAPQWLDIATARLIPGAVGPVRAEYLAQLEGALANGKSEEQVVAEWGDSHRVAHDLPHTAEYMPPLYARDLSGLRAAYRRDWVLPIVALAYLLLAVLIGATGMIPWVLLFLVLACALVALRWVVGWPGRPLRQRVWLEWLTDVVTLVAVFNTADALLRGHWNLAEWSTLDWLRALFVPWALYRLHRGLDAVRRSGVYA